MNIAPLLLSLVLAAMPAEAPAREELRAAVQRSIPYIEEKGNWWITEKKCVSCHRAGNMAWTLAAARSKGFKVSDRLDEWFAWSIEKSLAKNDQGKINGLGNKEGVAQLLLAREFFPAADRGAAYRQLQDILTRDQQPDGGWKAGGQLPGQKRPAGETALVSSQWIALALSQDAEQFGKAMQYVASVSTAKSTEWYAAGLLLALRSGDKPMTDELIAALRAQQRDDGGWGWLLGDESDALGTGLALYALLRAGVPRDDANVARAQHFLLATQRADGAWPVRGTKANKKTNLEETAIYWGTTWATLALVEGFERPPKTQPPE